MCQGTSIQVNPQKYYISLRKNRNFVFVKIKKKKIYWTFTKQKADKKLAKHYVS